MKKRKRFILGMVIFSVVLTSFTFYFYQVFYGLNILTEANDRTILIDKDDNFDSLRNYLYDNRTIQDVLSFSFVAKALKYQDNVKPGLYRLSSKSSNIEAIRKLRAGDQVPTEITFNNVRFKEELAEKISTEQIKHKKKIKVFTQVNIGSEEQKSGIKINELENFYRTCVDQLGLNIIGLMCLPPAKQDVRPFFKKMRELNLALGLKELSMGMSSDYLEAIELGSSFVRVGSKIFGNRN